MTPEEAQLAAIVESGRISAADADRLRRAMTPGTRWRVLLDPLEAVTPAAAWVACAVVVALSLALARKGVRFDGALDLHRAVRRAVPWRLALFDQANAIGVTAIVLWCASLVASRRGRVIDFVQAIAIARAPFLVTGLLTVLFMPTAAELVAVIRAGSPTRGLLVVSLASTPFFIWGIVLIYRGFALSAGLVKTRAAASFAIGIVLSEVVTKCVLVLVGTHLPR